MQSVKPSDCENLVIEFRILNSKRDEARTEPERTALTKEMKRMKEAWQIWYGTDTSQEMAFGKQFDEYQPKSSGCKTGIVSV